MADNVRVNGIHLGFFSIVCCRMNSLFWYCFTAVLLPLHCYGAALLTSCLLLNCLWCCNAVPCYNAFLFSAAPSWCCSANNLTSCLLLTCLWCWTAVPAKMFCFLLHHCGAALLTSCLLLSYLWCCTAVPAIILFCFPLHQCGAALRTS